MKDLILSFLLLLSFCNSSFGQKYLHKKNIQIGINGTIIKDQQEINTLGKVYTEKMLGINISTSLSPKITVGLNSVSILYTDWNSSKINKSNLFGLFGQYSIYSSRRFNFFGELSANRGNYCTCGDLFPYKKNGLIYSGIGIGIDFKVYKNIFVDLAFTNYNILNKLEGKYNFTRYIIGLKYIINFKETVHSLGS